MKYILLMSSFVLATSCSKNDSVSTTNTNNNGNNTIVSGTISILDVVKAKYYGATSITADATYITIKSIGTPDHKSVYWPNNNALFEAFSGTTFGGVIFKGAPNTIATQSITMKIPIFPALSASHTATPMGIMGMAINGVALFNQYAAGGTPLEGEKAGFDQSWGHPQMTGMYHYHVEPKHITTSKGNESLIGFLLDGFPVYAPYENGALVSETSLDVYHGHSSKTADFPTGIYHYHVTSNSPYINGSGFYGTPGTITQ